MQESEWMIFECEPPLEVGSFRFNPSWEKSHM